jgi:hypothetical protein
MLVGMLSILFSAPLAAQFELKRNVLNDTYATLEARWNRLGTFQKSAAYLKRITPFYSWINLCSVVDVEDKSFLVGNCLHDQARALFDMQTDQFRREYSVSIERLWTESPIICYNHDA